MNVKKLLAGIITAVVLFCTFGCEKSEKVQIFDADGERVTESTASSEAGTGFGSEDGTGYDAAETSTVGETAPIQNFPETEGNIFVYVCGAVEHPGVVEVPAGSRVFEAIREAGGMTADAAGFAVNQAALLEDGQQITVPTVEEAADWTPEESVQASAAGTTDADGEKKVNINTAAADELITLPGIGEAKAAGIIEYRESAGGFQSIEEIKDVSGIGDAVFEKIKDRIVI